MATDRGVVASFDSPEAAARAVTALREAGFEVHAAMPAPFPAMVTALGRPRSPIDFVTLPGALVGTALGILLTTLTSLAWKLITGGKPIVSWPPFIIVIFELTVLIGSLTNLVAVAVGSRVGGSLRVFPPHTRFNGDRIGVYAVGEDTGRAARILRDCGGEEVSDAP
jgi:molybdopterin-containing oxidoreductase family membrane subunit